MASEVQRLSALVGIEGGDATRTVKFSMEVFSEQSPLLSDSWTR